MRMVDATMACDGSSKLGKGMRSSYWLLLRYSVPGCGGGSAKRYDITYIKFNTWFFWVAFAAHF